MCRRRHVRNVYSLCGHAVNLPEEEVRFRSYKSSTRLLIWTVANHDRYPARILVASLAPTIPGYVPIALKHAGNTTNIQNSTVPALTNYALHARLQMDLSSCLL
ncbi:hypothetical protein L218DRAFT_129171 [Marasmius fiardii PR-910]|nr:hypothetical protein L218DRAFT_129171 [Marasmius fiardii PR-910]